MRRQSSIEQGYAAGKERQRHAHTKKRRNLLKNVKKYQEVLQQDHLPPLLKMFSSFTSVRKLYFLGVKNQYFIKRYVENQEARQCRGTA